MVPTTGKRALLAAAVSAIGISGSPAYAQTQTREASAPERGLALPSRPPLGQMRSDLFGAPPKPKVQKKVEVAAPPPAPPAAPAFPFKYAGRFTEGADAPRTYLQKDGQLVEIKAGTVLDGVWRIERFTADRLEVSFVPGAQQLSMTLESLSGGSEGARQTAVANAAPARGEAAPGQGIIAGTQPARSAPAQPYGANAPQVIGGVGLAYAPSPSSARSPGVGQRVTSPAPAPQNSQNAPAGPGSSTPPPSGILGAEAPKAGSMPTGPAPSGTSMQIGPPPAGTMPSSAPPSGKLGL
jgi:hypothetical protein